jgi:hypothetical protein
MENQCCVPTREVAVANPAHHLLAQWLVTTEMATADGPLPGPAAAGRVFEKLSRRVAQLITPVGAEALLKRAVHLSRAEVPFVAGLETAASTDSIIDRLREAATAIDPTQAQEGFVIVLRTLVGLLESFIGRDLTFRLLRDVWPDMPTSPPTT